ncbi:MAG: PEP-CTERM sorting domain-containing protein [Pirellulales bacterium]|nr:PEP-CTERM sorting domain-containing protein [Pirellulales bacterium]
MNQPRCVLLAAFALTALIVGPAIAQSTIDVSLNLRYTDPADPTEGGQFTLVAKTNDTIGIAAISAYLDNINSAGIALQTGIGGMTPIYVMSFTDGTVNAIYGQDISTTVVPGVGTASTPAGLIATDPLWNPAWNNVTSIMTGTFGGLRPAFTTEGSSSTGGNVLTKSTVPGSAAAATLTTTVRGDSKNGLGLETGTGLFAGDADRDKKVGPADLAIIGLNWAPAATTKGWDTGDFDDNGAVGPADLAQIGLNWDPTGGKYVPPTVAGVPEPASLVLLSLVGLALLALRIRK